MGHALGPSVVQPCHPLAPNMKTLIWDFDGTLAYREGGMFGASLIKAILVRRPDPRAARYADGLGRIADLVRH